MSKVENDWFDNESPATDYERIADVEWDDEPYQFNTTRVYQQKSTGKLFYATDSGCSCPSPFEDTEDTDLKPIARLQDWYDHVTARTILTNPDDDCQYPEPTPASAIDQADTARKTIEAKLEELAHR